MEEISRFPTSFVWRCVSNVSPEYLILILCWNPIPRFQFKRGTSFPLLYNCIFFVFCHNNLFQTSISLPLMFSDHENSISVNVISSDICPYSAIMFLDESTLQYSQVATSFLKYGSMNQSNPWKSRQIGVSFSFSIHLYFRPFGKMTLIMPISLSVLVFQGLVICIQIQPNHFLIFPF